MTLLRYLLSISGFDVVAIFDAPGPLTEPACTGHGNRSTARTGDRLHVVAGRAPNSPPALMSAAAPGGADSCEKLRAVGQ